MAVTPSLVEYSLERNERNSQVIFSRETAPVVRSRCLLRYMKHIKKKKYKALLC